MLQSYFFPLQKNKQTIDVQEKRAFSKVFRGRVHII